MFYDEEKDEQFASTVLRIASTQIKRFPGGFGRMLATAEFQIAEAKEIAIIGGKGNDLAKEVFSEYMPFKVVALTETGSEFPLLKDRGKVNGKTTAYVCRDFVCERPVTEVKELRELL